jgi:hypothetical protein
VGIAGREARVIRLLALIALALVLVTPVSAASGTTIHEKTVTSTTPIEFLIHTASDAPLSARANWAGKGGVGTLYVVQDGVAECSIAGFKPLACDVHPSGTSDVAPAGWYEVELFVSDGRPDLSNVSVTVSGDIDQVVSE